MKTDIYHFLTNEVIPKNIFIYDQNTETAKGLAVSDRACAIRVGRLFIIYMSLANPHNS